MVKEHENTVKVKSRYLINIDSRADEQKRKFTKWIAAQRNPQNSFLSLIEHCIDRFGYEDVTDHNIAKKLHTEILYFNNERIDQDDLRSKINNNYQSTERKNEKKEESNKEDREETISADLSSF
ncbi:hypothetical protein [Virgibacillus sp. Bac332]|uniref:hypothetical protein n=1 Tax=Virgibacillus sp. Bac332 TaxID=2419842 RepID=UPI000EF4496E|nr:hypothetical protein [Virgibacillus sp. Bac332]